MKTKIFEGVTYARFAVSFRLLTEPRRRRRWLRWSPASGQWARTEAVRELVDTFGSGIVPRSVVVRRAE